MGLISRTTTMGLKGRPLRAAVTAVATLGFSLFGYDQGLMSGIITGDQFNKEFPPTWSDPNGSEAQNSHASVIQGAVTSCYELGCFFGALFALFRGDRIGRKPLVIAGSLIIVVGTVISVASFHHSWGLGQFVIGRVITGIGNGLDTATIPVWQSEMSKAHNRGRLVNLEGSVVAVGTFIAYWIDFGFSYTHSSVQWRFPVAFQAFFAICVFAGMINLPESPRWLIAHNRKPEAMEVLGKLNDCSPEDDSVLAEVTQISEAIMRFSKNKVKVKEMFSGGKNQNFARMIIGASTQFFQQITGCNASIYYSTILFENSIGLDRELSLIMGGVFSTVYALFTIPSFFLVDSFGRRNLFLVGATGQAVSFTITFACLAAGGKENAKGAAVGIFLFIAFFAFTILPLPWLFPPELNSLRTRTMATAVSTCTNWIMNFAVVMFTPVFIDNSGKGGFGCYLFFAAINYLFIPVIYFFYPETAGRSLEEVDIIFAKAHVENRLPFRVAQTLPKLTLQEIHDESNNLGLWESEFEKENFDIKESLSDSASTPREDGILAKDSNEEN